MGWLVYKKYIKRNGKTFGPYIYHSKKIKGKVITEYRGKYKDYNFNILIFISIFIVFSFAMILILNPNYIYNMRGIAMNSFDSITGLVTEGQFGETTSEISPEVQQTENINESTQKEISDETPILETPQEIQNSSLFITNESDNISLNMITNKTEIIEETPTENTTEIVTNKTEIMINETEIINETIFNETLIVNFTDGNLTIQTTQFQAVLNQKVKWISEVTSENPINGTIAIPAGAENIIVTVITPENEETSFAITGAIIGTNLENWLFKILNKIFGKITGDVVDENPENEQEQEIQIEINESIDRYDVEYFTPAPESMEEEIANGKRVVISGPENLHYENVLAFTDLNENLNIKNPEKIKILFLIFMKKLNLWMEFGARKSKKIILSV